MRSRVWPATALAVFLVAGACGSTTSGRELEALLAQSPAEGSAAGGAGESTPATPLPGETAPAVGSSLQDLADSPVASTSATPDVSGRSPGTPGAGAPTPNAGGVPRPGATPAVGRAPEQGRAATDGGRTTPSVPGAPSPPAAAGRCNGAPIVLGSVGQLSGVLGEIFRPIVKSVQTWAAKANDSGGVNCHRITVITADDGGDPARHQGLVRQMVEEKGVIAFAPLAAPITARASKDYLNQKRVPVIGSVAEMIFYDSPMHFPVYSSDELLFETTALAAGTVAVSQGKKKAGTLTCQEVEACNAGEKAFQEWAPKGGLQIVYNAKTSLANPDFTSICLQARNAGVEVMIGSADGSTYRRFMRDCAKLDYHPLLVILSGQAQPTYPSDPLMEGVVVTMPTQPWFYDTPAAAEYRAAVNRYVTGDFNDVGGILGWTIAKAVEAASRGIGPAMVPTSEAIIGGLYALNGDDLGGLTHPVHLRPSGPKDRIRCYWIISVGKGRWESTDRRMHCYEGGRAGS